jgi:hypothetical protein
MMTIKLVRWSASDRKRSVGRATEDLEHLRVVARVPKEHERVVARHHPRHRHLDLAGPRVEALSQDNYGGSVSEDYV